jgi:hypothetical protein
VLFLPEMGFKINGKPFLMNLLAKTLNRVDCLSISYKINVWFGCPMGPKGQWKMGNAGSVFYIVKARNFYQYSIIPTAHENTNDFCINAFQKFDLG